MEALISVQHLYKYHEEDLILDDISFSIETGDLVSIIGPSGCGKSTLLRCLNCLDIFDSGTVTIDGITLSRPMHAEAQTVDEQFLDKAHALRQQVGMVFQSFNLFPNKTLLENIMLAPVVVKKERQDMAKAKAMELLEKVGLSGLAHRRPWSLSGGQKQRAAIARALAMQPKVMLYDEPTSALDPGMVEEVLEVMRHLDHEGMTQIIVTHEMRFARDASDYIIYIENGKIIEISDEDEIFISPKDERTRKFLRRYM
jgi:polar amino acid transport system ATP-binding protein